MSKIVYSSFLSKVALGRKPSAIRSLYPLMNLPGMISFAAGVPNPKTFPFKTCSFSLKDGTEIEFSPKQLDDALQYTATVCPIDFIV
jgi:tryptophan aminotransferase